MTRPTALLAGEIIIITIIMKVNIREKKDLNFEYFGGGIIIWLKHIWCCMRYKTQKL